MYIYFEKCKFYDLRYTQGGYQVEKNKKIINEIHLYNNKIEMLIKLIILIISWMGGVLVLKDSKEGLGSAYFIFTLSLLMEVIPQINKKMNLLVEHFIQYFVLLFRLF